MESLTKTTTDSPKELVYPRQTLPVILSREREWDGYMNGGTREVVRAESNTLYGGTIILEPSEVQGFVDSGLYPTEYAYWQGCMGAAYDIRDALPAGELRDAVPKAIEAKVMDLLLYTRERHLSGELSDEEKVLIERSGRELTFALGAVAKALSVHHPDYVYVPDHHCDTYVWYVDSHRGRNGGYHSVYRVCNDTYDPDDEDHARQLDNLKVEAEKWDGEEMWPDEFHHPAELKIHVDPVRRIEFVYTPEIVTAKERHHSHSYIVEPDGKEKHYENQSLSIRIDLDPTAPAGIALDIGRSAYEGTRDGRYMKRGADLLGGVFAQASATASHEYTGFESSMAAQFRNFAERFAIQLNLQHREFRKPKRPNSLPRTHIPKVYPVRLGGELLKRYNATGELPSGMISHLERPAEVKRYVIDPKDLL